MPEIILIVHNIRSTHNVGSIFRTAEGFGVSKIILSGYTPYPKISGDARLPHISERLTTQIHKTALGAETMVAFEYIEKLEDVIVMLRHNKTPILALEQSTKSIKLRDFSPPEKCALLLGEEVHGIDSAVLDQCDAILEIPMLGQKESFNVSVATGIALYALTQ